MYFLEEFYIKTIKLNLINKFIYNKSKKLPKLKKISFSFNYKVTNIKDLSSSNLALELITKQKGIMILIKKSNSKFRLRKGNPIGCKVTLRKINMFRIFIKLLVEIWPKHKIIYILKSNNKIIPKNLFVGQIKNLFNFEEFHEQYYSFNTLSNLNFVISTNSNKKEHFFILKSFKFPFKIKN